MSQLREQLLVEQPEMCKFLDDMKAGFGAVVLHVSTPTLELGKEPATGISPYMPLPSSTWPYKVGESPSMKPKAPAKRARK